MQNLPRTNQAVDQIVVNKQLSPRAYVQRLRILTLRRMNSTGCGQHRYQAITDAHNNSVSHLDLLLQHGRARHQ